MPFAPASTTPASRSTGRSDGVRSTEAAAAATAVSEGVQQGGGLLGALLLQRAGDIGENREDRALRGVADRGPGQGRGAQETCSEVSARAGLLPFQRLCQASENLRQDHAAVSPGPLHGPPAMLAETEETVEAEPGATVSRRPSSAARTVRSMFVPVSPSGTGNTFSASSDCAPASSQSSADSSIRSSVTPSAATLLFIVSRPRGPVPRRISRAGTCGKPARAL